ncbi:MAG: helix-turn-helix transcriptional regulator [Muribaculaceae bacterium]|nr:helix-turn-helix transcriptional regulator [Muribaculaceae bacterium]
MKKTNSKIYRDEAVRKNAFRSNVNLDKLREIVQPESEEELAIENDLEENGELYKASMRIAMKVRRALRISGMTQLALAETLGMDPAVVSKSLNGKANLELKTLVKLEKALGINIIDRSISKPVSKPTYSIQVFRAKKDLNITPPAIIGNKECDVIYPKIRGGYSARQSLNKRVVLQRKMVSLS